MCYKNIKKIKISLILLPLIILGIVLYFSIYKYKNNQNIYKDTTKVINTINQVLDINTVKYNYSNVITVKKDKSINEIKIPFTEKSFVVKYDGIINAGVRPENIKVLKNDGKDISIEVKKCEILDHYIDDENFYIYDIKNSIFNKLNVQEVIDDVNKYKKDYEKKLIQEGFMDEVKNNTKSSIENILKNIGYKNIEVLFK